MPEQSEARQRSGSNHFMSYRSSEETIESNSLRLLPDEEVVRALLAGDEQAMEVLFARYYRMVMRVALRIVRDPGEAQDVVQIVFTDFYRAARLFDVEKGSLKTWLLQYAYGRSVNRKESLKNRNFYRENDADALSLVPSDQGTRFFNMELAELRLLADQVLAALDDKQRKVIESVCFRGLTMAETATALGDSLGNVNHAYYRGLEKLRVFLKTGRRPKYRSESEDSIAETGTLLSTKPVRQ